MLALNWQRMCQQNRLCIQNPWIFRGGSIFWSWRRWSQLIQQRLVTFGTFPNPQWIGPMPTALSILGASWFECSSSLSGAGGNVGKIWPNKPPAFELLKQHQGSPSPWCWRAPRRLWWRPQWTFLTAVSPPKSTSWLETLKKIFKTRRGDGQVPLPGALLTLGIQNKGRWLRFRIQWPRLATEVVT